MEELIDMTSIPPKIGGPSLESSEIDHYLLQVPGWEVVVVDGVEQLTHQYKFKNFVEALEFTNRVGELAEQEDHHPAILTEWGKVSITWWTHAVKGLHVNDFICAAKTDRIFAN
jgi:4a-hydroxytetrahydrobiopterin dehydratase